MPFLLRRTKDEVLSDLPEKIIQDRYCDLSPIQLKLYEQFSGSHVRQEISSMVKQNEDAGAAPKASSHVFQVCRAVVTNPIGCFLAQLTSLFSVSGTSIFVETLWSSITGCW